MVYSLYEAEVEEKRNIIFFLIRNHMKLVINKLKFRQSNTSVLSLACTFPVYVCTDDCCNYIMLIIVLIIVVLYSTKLIIPEVEKG